MDLESRLQLLREKIKNNSVDIIDKLIRKNGDKDLCIFCGSKDGLTKEHVLPK